MTTLAELAAEALDPYDGAGVRHFDEVMDGRVDRRRKDLHVNHLADKQFRSDLAPPKPPLAERALKFSQVVALPPPRWAVAGLLPASSVNFLAGREGTLKSYITLDVLVSIATGQPAFDRETEQGACLYITLEGNDGLSSRYEAIKKHRGLTDAVLEPMLHTDLGPFDARNDDDIEQLIEFIKANSITFVGVDTLARATPGANRDSELDMMAMVANFDRVVAETGACILIVAHSAKGATPENPIRGSASITDSAHSVYYVTKLDDSTVNVHTSKQKVARKAPDFALTLEDVEVWVSGEQVTNAVLRPADLADLSAAAASAKPSRRSTQDQRRDLIVTSAGGSPAGLTVPDFVKITEASRNTVVADCFALVEQGRLARTGVNPVIYTAPVAAV